jgi:selenocysteine lyase/cysteine desulfurase
MDEFLAAYPDYATTSRLDELRDAEYAYLDAGGHVYLDYTGAGLAADAQLRAHVERLRSGCFGNPHSENPASAASTVLIAQAREAVLRHFNASPQEYAAIFTQNATGACRLVGESYRFQPWSRLLLTTDNHNSVLGLREFARAHGIPVRYVPMASTDLRIHDEDVSAAIGHGPGGGRRPGLFAYPAQSNFSGVQHPLAWVSQAQAAGWEVLLDAAAFVPTNRLDLGTVKPEFVTVSWYKVFGYPTGIGCLLVKRDALARLRRPWFSGGTVVSSSVQGDWHRLAEDESAFEDGTVNFLAIPDLTTGLAWISDIGIDLIHRRVGYLTRWLLSQLAALKHGDGAPMVRLYGPADGQARGGTVAFNLLDPRGAVVDERVVARDASAAGISVRTGCFCNPGAGERAFGLTG